MRPHDQPYGLCTIDPISAALGGIIPAILGGGGGGDKAPAPAPPPSAPPPQQQPVGSKKTAGMQQPSFLGSVATPPPSTGNKTLLGQ